ncbi:MAG: hypothetical protein IKT98_04845 [Selenomonadaceae bacterium]|nr:hypothetical protein [Selenomonadaceae bacterium]
MTEQEKINQQLQNQIDSQNARLDKALSNFDTKFNMMMEEIRQQREDMRRLWERQDAMQAKHDAEMHEMNERFYNKIDENFKTLSNQIHNNFVQTMLGFGAIAAAVGGIVIAAFK